MDTQQRAEMWANERCFSTETRQETKRILQDPSLTTRCFGGELAFGTGGLRGLLGVGTARMNRYTVARATLGLANYLLTKNAAPTVVIAYDSRHGSDTFAEAAAQILCDRRVKTYVFPRIAPTPVLSYAVRALRCDAGIMITASHNPATYNGYKVYGSDGCQITDAAAAAITRCIDAIAYTDLTFMREGEARRQNLWHTVTEDIPRGFAQACLFCRPNPTICQPIHAIYTPLHGTGLLPVREVLSHMQGVKVTEVEAQCTPDGDFSTCPKPNPELDEALALGVAKLEETGADILLATDPDCDRVGVVVRHKDGLCHRLSGNEVGLLLCDYILKTRAQAKTLPKHPLIVKTIVTSDLAFSIAKAYGAEVQEVLTGFKYIGEVIGKLEKSHQGDRFIFGFEESCGYLTGTHVRDKDGVMACMLVCEMAQAYAAAGQTLWDGLQALYARHGYMENALLSFDITGDLPMAEMAEKMKQLRANPPAFLDGSPIETIKDYSQGINGLPKSNVLSYQTNDGLKAIVRPSGTEPKIKLYLSVKASTPAQARQRLARLQGQCP